MRHRGAALGLAILLSSGGFPALAQPQSFAVAQVDQAAPAVQAPPGGLVPGPRDFNAVRQELRQLLFQLPPNVRVVLQNDPSLATTPGYLDPYPQLVRFFEEHPEVMRNPSFFLGGLPYTREPNPLEAFAAVLAGTGAFIVMMTIIVMIGAVGKQVVDYRRWVRQSRTQTEVHTKILDRLQSNEDLLAYVQTPAARRFLEFSSAGEGGQPHPATAPFGRILWSVQAGVVLTALGLGLWYAQRSVPEEIVGALNVLSTVVVAVGLGAVASAVVAYVLSARLGILPASRAPRDA
jgi:hypothetical protein